MPPKVFVILLNYNSREFILETLASLFRIDYSNWELIFLDNGSWDESLELARKFYPKAVYIKNRENLGFSGGNNVGIKYALERGADYILLLNHDTSVEKDFLRLLVDFMENNKEIGLASPLIWEKGKKRIWYGGGKISWLRMRSYHLREFTEINKKAKTPDFITGCSMLVRKEVFKKIGLLDEDYFLYWEDCDFSFRAKKAGYLLSVFPSSQIIHFEKSETENKNKTYWLVLSGLLFFAKNSSFWQKPFLYVIIYLRQIKNSWKVRFRKEEAAVSVKKAYEDFKRFRKDFIGRNC